MKLVNFLYKGNKFLGLKTEKGIVDINSLVDENVGSMMELLRKYSVRDIKDLFGKIDNSHIFINEDEISYLPVVEDPEKILCVGFNYLKHVGEIEGIEIPKCPIIFSKMKNVLAAHNEDIACPTYGKNFDYEAELVLIIGKEGKDVPKEEVDDYIFGFTIGNDLTLRDLQFLTSQWLIGKSADKTGPIGPYISLNEGIDAKKLQVQMRRNGLLVQNNNTENMIFDYRDIVSYVSKMFTLKPGDLIFTGTPEGIIQGSKEEDRVWLHTGDCLEVSIEGLGSLVNRIV